MQNIRHLKNGILENEILSSLKTIIIWSNETTDCVDKLAIAAPWACSFGISRRLIITFTIIPAMATIFNNFIFPLAVSNVPKI